MTTKKYWIKSSLGSYILNCYYWNGVWQTPMSTCPLAAREYTENDGIRIIKILNTEFLGMTFNLEEVV